ncbi:hypothetical protein [Paenibacillus pinihumi]|uniref:hypothetical protein n=1 Tax=Paenibacillus pinihumi TaxID=669462 RepID=UPI00055B9C47|nr:hypothetical protein [Paenibacillus pinihumi]
MTQDNGNLSLDELRAAANEMSLRHWGVPFTGTLNLTNRRWKRTHGMFLRWASDPARTMIQMCTSMNASRPREEVLKTLLHELVHWRLYTTGVPCRDTDLEFVAECVRVGASISQTKSAQAAYKRYLAIKGYEERTGRSYDENTEDSA